MKQRHIKRRTWLPVLWLGPIGTLGAVLALSGPGCGSSGDGSSDFGQSGGPGASGGANANGTGAGAGTGAGLFTTGNGGASGTANGGVGSGITGSNGAGVINPDAACATGSATAALLPLNLFIMLDRSGSMKDDNKWTDATAAMEAFVQDPGTAGLRIALRFFPDNTPVNGCDDNGCSIDACSTPKVPLAAVTKDPAPTDVQEEALVTAINGTKPGNGGGTPLFAALGGAEKWATTYAAGHKAEKVVILLVTDGMPNGCDESIDDIAGEAAANLPSGILTYAVGLEGSSEMQMDQIAKAGGTTQAFFIGTGNAQADLLTALKAIQGKNLSCSFAMPVSTDPSKPIDPAKINVDYTPGTGAEVSLGEVTAASACGTTGGWYYDNNAAPTTITLCPTNCTAVQADANAKIDVLLGCATQMSIPK